MRSLARFLAVLLLAGTALLGIGALMHPMLDGDAAHQLQTIADTSFWRLLHLAMLAGSGLVAVGLWTRFLEGSRAGGALAAALAVLTIGECVNALNIAYMAGSGWHLASMFTAGHAEAGPIFEATHPIGLMAARFGNFVVAIGAILLGWVEWSGIERPRLFAGLAWIAGAGGLVGVALFDESSRAILAAVALLSGWQVLEAFHVLRASSLAPPTAP